MWIDSSVFGYITKVKRRQRERQVMYIYIYVYIVKPLKNLFIRAVRTTQMIQENENLRMESRKETRHADRNGGIKWNGTYSEWFIHSKQHLYRARTKKWRASLDKFPFVRFYYPHTKCKYTNERVNSLPVQFVNQYFSSFIFFWSVVFFFFARFPHIRRFDVRCFKCCRISSQ